MPHPVESKFAATRWTVRIIPFFIAGALGFTVYAVVGRICVDYLYRQRHKRAAAVVLITLSLVFLLLTIATYVRTFLTAQFYPGLVPYQIEPTEQKEVKRKRRSRGHGRGRDIESQPWVPPDTSLDSPGLEAFYSKNVFVCEGDGRPKWCSECRQWKPDRAHHSSELGRCVRKMDHLCPWVGGMVSETCFNFFFQFTTYVSAYCVLVGASAAYALALQQREGKGLDGVIVAAIALAGFFVIFTFGMTMTSLRFVLTNTTNIDLLRRKQVFLLAVRVPRGSPSTSAYHTITYPLQDPAGARHPTEPNGNANNAELVRDEQAIRTFAILRTEPGENPWDVGYWNNFKSVMGNNVFEWLLPIRHSPCCNHESMESDYPMGKVVSRMATRANIPRKHGSSCTENGIDMGSEEMA